ncbi:MAG: GNAT family N-acetyltransferase [Candidatus Izemoplasmatales bacterium]
MPADVPAILALQDQAAGDMPERVFVRTKEAELGILGEDGIGLWIEAGDGSPAAFGMAVTDRGTVATLHRDVLGHLGDPADVWMIDTVFVAPSWRGFGLQRHLLGRFVALARERGIPLLLATVSPENRHSLDNFLAMGFAEVGRGAYYGGYERCVMAKRI